MAKGESTLLLLWNGKQRNQIANHSENSVINQSEVSSCTTRTRHQARENERHSNRAMGLALTTDWLNIISR